MRRLGWAYLVLALMVGVCVSGQGDQAETGPIRDEGIIAREEAWSKCDRKRSRQARAIVKEEVHPVVEKRGYQLPANCPLSKEQDMYLDNELVSSACMHRFEFLSFPLAHPLGSCFPRKSVCPDVQLCSTRRRSGTRIGGAHTATKCSNLSTSSRSTSRIDTLTPS